MNFVIKLSKLCNLRCTYCYEYEELANKDRMSLENLDFFFKNLAPYLQQKSVKTPVKFILHGGEPLLLPDSYLQSLRDIQKKYLEPAGIIYQNLLQTNLTKLTDEKLKILQSLNIKLGVSLDVFGDQRVDISGKLSQDKVLDNLQRLLDAKVPFGAIAVLHALNIDRVLQHSGQS